MNASVASLSPLLIFFEVIQWFHADGNFIFAADFQEKNQTVRDFVWNHDTVAISWKIMTVIWPWLKSFSGMIMHKIVQTIFSRQMFISVVSSLVLCMYKFVLNLFYLLLYSVSLAGLGNFTLPVGLSEWKITTGHPISTEQLCFKRTFEAKILKIFNDIQPSQPKN